MAEQAPEPQPCCDRLRESAHSIEDAHLAVTEVTNVHIYHPPNNPCSVSGLTFVLRGANSEFTVCLREGLSGNGVEPVRATPFQTGCDEYADLIDMHGSSLETVQQAVAELGPIFGNLLADLKA